MNQAPNHIIEKAEEAAGPMTKNEALARILNIDATVRDLQAQVKILTAERLEIITAQGQAVAKFKIGQDVDQPYGYGRNKSLRTYRITRIGGWFWSPRRVMEDAGFDVTTTDLPEDMFTATYYGCQVKKDGSLSDKEKKLYGIEESL